MKELILILRLEEIENTFIEKDLKHDLNTDLIFTCKFTFLVILILTTLGLFNQYEYMFISSLYLIISLFHLFHNSRKGFDYMLKAMKNEKIINELTDEKRVTETRLSSGLKYLSKEELLTLTEECLLLKHKSGLIFLKEELKTRKDNSKQSEVEEEVNDLLNSFNIKKKEFSNFKIEND